MYKDYSLNDEVFFRVKTEIKRGLMGGDLVIRAELLKSLVIMSN